MKATMEIERCPLCAGRRHRHFERCQSSGAVLTYRICQTCGLVFQSPRMAETELKEYYACGYRQSVQDSDRPVEKDLRVQAGRARALRAFCTGHLASVKRHLDIGCSAGKLLLAFAEEYGCESVGVEPGDAYRAYCRNLGLTVYSDIGRIDQAARNSFDLVSMAHVLEHLPEPIEYLSDLREKWMSPSANLLLEVPNLYGHEALELSHLFAFNAQTLRETLERAGYETRLLETHGRPRSPILRRFITVLARAGSTPKSIGQVKSSPKAVKLRRRLGMLMVKGLSIAVPRWAWHELPEL